MKTYKKIFGPLLFIIFALITLVSCGNVAFPEDGEYHYSSSSVSGLGVTNELKESLESFASSHYEGSILKVEGKFISMCIDDEWEDAIEYKADGKKIVPIENDKEEETYITISGSTIIMHTEMAGINVQIKYVQ